MLLGAYTYAILSVPVADRAAVYYLYGGSAVNFSFQDLFGSLFGREGLGGAVSMGLGVVAALILGGCVAAVFACLIGLPAGFLSWLSHTLDGMRSSYGRMITELKTRIETLEEKLNSITKD